MNRLLTERLALATDGPRLYRVLRHQKRQLTLFALFTFLLGGPVAQAAGELTARLDGSDPFRLVVDASGKPQRITVHGENFENSAHPDRGQYMHWQIRRDDGGWQRCGATAGCKTDGWSHNSEALLIGDSFVARSGFVELRFFVGLGAPTITDPSQVEPGARTTGWSNLLRVPVVVPAAAPVIKSLSKKEFPVAAHAQPDDYRFFIDASGVSGQGQVAVVFRGDVVVGPERIHDGHLIQVSVPEIYRSKTAGELSLTVRTDRGGDSTRSYIRFKAPPKTEVATTPAGKVGVLGAAIDRRAGNQGGGFVPREAGAGTDVKTNASSPIDPKKIPVATAPAARSPVVATMDYITPLGRKTKGEVHGNRLYLFDPRGKAVPAADGTYRGIDGASIIVQGGIIVQNGIIVQGGRVSRGARFGTPGGVEAIGPKQDDPAGPGKAGRQASGGIGNDAGMLGGIRTPGGIKAIGPKQDDPSRPGAAGRWDDNSTQDGIRTPGGIKAIGPKQDDPARPGKAGRQASDGIGNGGIPAGIRNPGGIKAIGPKQDDPARPGKSGLQQQGTGGPGKVGTPGGIEAIGPKQDDPAAPGKGGAQGVIAPIDIRGPQ